MLKKTSFIALICLISSFLFFISACSDQNNPSHNADCQSNKTNCLTLLSTNAKVFINSEFIMVEQAQKITIESNRVVKSAKLIPLNMNMGEVPIVLKQTQTKVQEKSTNNYQFEAVLYLGMCSEPEMNWLLILSYIDGEIDSIPVNSYWNRKAYLAKNSAN